VFSHLIIIEEKDKPIKMDYQTIGSILTHLGSFTLGVGVTTYIIGRCFVMYWKPQLHNNCCPIKEEEDEHF